MRICPVCIESKPAVVQANVMAICGDCRTRMLEEHALYFPFERRSKPSYVVQITRVARPDCLCIDPEKLVAVYQERRAR